MEPGLNSGIEIYLKSIQNDINELKNKQFAGADNLRIYLLQSDNAYDHTFTVSGATPPFTENKIFNFLFDGRYQDYFFYQLSVDLWINSVDPGNKVRLTDDNIRANIAFDTEKFVRIPINVDLDNGTYYMKVYFLSTDQGTGSASIIEV